MKHPIQPIERDKEGTLRFKENKIVRFLLDRGKFDMNDIASMDFSKDDRQQFAQLIGYSVSGFGELSYVDDETYEAASVIASGSTGSEVEVRNEYLRLQLDTLRKALRQPIANLYGIHPDDLKGAL